MFSEELSRIDAAIAKQKEKQQVLQELDFFMLDNSIRESTVGQLRGHTVENKMKIYEEVKKCGFKHIVVASFSNMTRVDDVFVKQLVDRGEDPDRMYAFSEVTESIKDGILDIETIPVALRKMKELNLRNPIFEIDLADKNVDWTNKFTVDKLCQLLLRRINWTYENLSGDTRIFVNFRDFPFAMKAAPDRVLTVAHFLAKLPAETRPFGLIHEDPSGNFLPEEIGIWTASVRRVMNSNGWQSGKLLVHVHKKWGLAETVQLECLCNGADGVWASLCEEGAAMGHACSTVTIMNLVRMGNKRVLENFNCTYLRTAAINVTEITTGSPPHPKQVVYGERSLDLSFDLGGIAGGHVDQDDFDMATFFGVEPPKRISTLASAKMIQDRLVDLFGDSPQFTEEIALEMQKMMIKDLTENRKEEYMSSVGIAILFDRAGGKLTAEMSDIIEKMELNSLHAKRLIDDVRAIWDTWDLQDEVQGDDALQFDSFYNGFMSPYFGCFRCEDTRKGLQAIDMNTDNLVEWKEFLVYLKWALNEYPEIADTNELLSTAFRRGIIPAMRDEIIKTPL